MTQQPAKKQRGMALLIVLMIIALMMVIAVAINERGFTAYQRTQFVQNSQQGKWFALSAEQMVGLILRADARDDSTHTHLSQYWATGLHTSPQEGVTLNISVRDARACFNLNALVNETQNNSSTESLSYPAQVFMALLIQLSVDELQATQITASLQDWLDSDTIPRQYGAEDSVYAAARPPYLTANQPMQDISELRLVNGISAEIYQKLTPYVCALPDNKLRVNINTLTAAQSALLSALTLNKTGREQAENMLTTRPRNGWNDVNAFLAILTSGQENSSEASSLQSSLTVNSDYFLSRIDVSMGEQHYILHSLLYRHEGAVRTLQRTTGIQGDTR